ncbi:MAG TPA: AI-2E family transporter [Gemmatimonadales bacterium]|nr:AI-2E family transporter [Gemmatimonadales bacterium]
MVTTQESPLLRYVLIGAGVAVIAAALKSAASTVNLILVSALLAATLYPMPVALTKRGMKRGSAIALTAIVAVAGGILLLLVLAKSLSNLSEKVPAYKASMATQVEGLSARLATRGISLDQALKPDPERFMNTVGRLARAGLSSLGYGLFALVLIVLFLIEFPLFASAESGPGTLRYRLDEAMRLVRRFVGLNGTIGAVIAAIDLALMLVMGTDAAALWAVICFLFAFVPFGFILSAIPPVIVTLLEHGAGRAGLLFVLFFVVNFIGDNVIKPKYMGAGLGLSPLVIILSLMIWGVVLGPMGALLAIPLTLTLKQILPVLTGESAAVKG